MRRRRVSARPAWWVDPLPEEPGAWAASPLKTEGGGAGRELADLPAGFLDRLVQHYLTLAVVLLRPAASALRPYLPTPADVRQQAVIWLLEAAASYDDQAGIPFAGYLASALAHRPYDLVRERLGRGPSDWATALSRATHEHLGAHYREPNDQELAAALHTTAAKIRYWRLHISAVTSQLRPVDLTDGTLPAPSVPGYEPAGSAPTLLDDPAVLLDEDATAQLIAQTLLNTALDQAPPGVTWVSEVNVTGFAGWYLHTMGGLYKQDIARLGGIDQRKLVARMNRLRDRIRHRYTPDLVGGPTPDS